jgi:hypothetical protein
MGSSKQTLTGSATQRVYMVHIDNRNNTADAYVKFWDVVIGSVTVGTTAPDAVLWCPAGKRRQVFFVEGMKFSTAITVACVTTGGTGGTTALPEDVAVEIVYGS